MTETRELEYPRFVYGGFRIRFLSFCIDSLVIYSLNEIFYKLLLDGKNLSLIWGLQAYDVNRRLIAFLYYVLLTYFTDGRTLGKIVCGLRVVSFDGSKLKLSQVITREVFMRFVEEKIKILYLVIVFTPLKQSLGDYFADTLVVKENELQFMKENF